MNEEKTQLRACPFCGGNPRVAIWMQMKEKCMQATCQRCGSSSAVFHGEAHAELFAAWNRRASPSVNEEKTEAAGGVGVLFCNFCGETGHTTDACGRAPGEPTCERPNLRSLWGGCKLGSGCQCTSAAQQGECEHRADGVKVTRMPISQDQQTQDQAAAVMLLHGTPEQQAEALRTRGVPACVPDQPKGGA